MVIVGSSQNHMAEARAGFDCGSSRCSQTTLASCILISSTILGNEATEYLTAPMKTISNRMKEKAKNEWEHANEDVPTPATIVTLAADPNVATTSAPSQDLALLNQDVKLSKY